MNIAPDSTKPNAKSVEALQKLYQNNDRGWLFADYYFDNVMTDPRARAFIFGNTDMVYKYSNGYVRVFHWDKSQKQVYDNIMATYLDGIRNTSQILTLPLSFVPTTGIDFYIEAEGLLFDNQFYIQVNGTNIPINKVNASIPQDTFQRQYFVVKVPASVLQMGQNQLLFILNITTLKKSQKGVAVYNLKFSGA